MDASLQKARKYSDSWVWWSLERYFLINHCIILFEIMLLSKNKFNTVCFFHCFAEHSSCDTIPWWMQAFCVIKPPCSERGQKRPCNIQPFSATKSVIIFMYFSNWIGAYVFKAKSFTYWGSHLFWKIKFPTYTQLQYNVL